MARACLWEHNYYYKRLKLAQLLSQLISASCALVAEGERGAG